MPSRPSSAYHIPPIPTYHTPITHSIPNTSVGSPRTPHAGRGRQGAEGNRGQQPPPGACRCPRRFRPASCKGGAPARGRRSPGGVRRASIGGRKRRRGNGLAAAEDGRTAGCQALPPAPTGGRGAFPKTWTWGPQALNLAPAASWIRHAFRHSFWPAEPVGPASFPPAFAYWILVSGCWVFRRGCGCVETRGL